MTPQLAEILDAAVGLKTAVDVADVDGARAAMARMRSLADRPAAAVSTPARKPSFKSRAAHCSALASMRDAERQRHDRASVRETAPSKIDRTEGAR